MCYHHVARVQIPMLMSLCSLSLLLVLSFAPRGFFPGTPVFLSPQKPTLQNSDSTRNEVDKEPLSGRATSKSLYILFNKKNRGEGAVILIIISSALFRLNKNGKTKKSSTY